MGGVPRCQSIFWTGHCCFCFDNLKRNQSGEPITHKHLCGAAKYLTTIQTRPSTSPDTNDLLPDIARGLSGDAIALRHGCLVRDIYVQQAAAPVRFAHQNFFLARWFAPLGQNAISD